MKLTGNLLLTYLQRLDTETSCFRPLIILSGSALLNQILLFHDK